MKRREFEQSVLNTIHALPLYFRARLDNVEIVVADWPDRATMRAAGVTDPSELHGFYHGIPLTERGSSSYGLLPPDVISIYRRPILLSCQTDEEVRELIRVVVRHEVAHYFGLDDDRLRELGAY